MREENVSSQVLMGWLFGNFLDPCHKFFVQVVAAELFNQFIVIDLLSCVVGDHVRVDDDLFFFNWMYDILFCLWFILCGLNMIQCGLGSLFGVHWWERGLEVRS